jgi:hypothetical protein
VFFVNLFRHLHVLNLMIFRTDEERPDCASTGSFPALAIAIGALQLALDRGERSAADRRDHRRVHHTAIGLPFLARG